MLDFYHVRYLIFPGTLARLEHHARGAVARCYLNAQSLRDAESIIRKRLEKLGWMIDYLEKSEPFSINNFDPQDHTPSVVQKGIDGKIAVDIEFW